MRTQSKVILASVFTFILVSPTYSQNAITSQQADQILEELRSIRKNLEQRPLPANPGSGAAAKSQDSKVSYPLQDDGQSLGSPDARIVLVEYSDYQCPFCNRYHTDAFPKIKATYIDTGKIRYMSRDFPLGFHENAFAAAISARCAGEQGKFWDFRHTLIMNSNQLQPEKIQMLARQASLDADKFKICMESNNYKSAVDRDMAEATSAGVTGTPSFVLGRLQNGKLEGVRLVGALPYQQFDEKIREALEQR